MAVIGFRTRGRLASAAVLIAMAASNHANAVRAQETGGHKLSLACSLGETAVCNALIARPRLAAGLRAAIEQHLIELDERIAGCDRGDLTLCRELLSRYPALPQPVRDAAQRRLAPRP